MYAGDDGTPGKSQCLSVPRTDHPDPTAGFGKYVVPMAASHKSCVQKWPPFLADGQAKTGGYWSVIERPEGKQWTYQGRPLLHIDQGPQAGRHQWRAEHRSVAWWHLAMAPLDFPPGLKLLRHPTAWCSPRKTTGPFTRRKVANKKNACEMAATRLFGRLPPRQLRTLPVIGRQSTRAQADASTHSKVSRSMQRQRVSPVLRSQNSENGSWWSIARAPVRHLLSAGISHCSARCTPTRPAELCMCSRARRRSG